MNIDTHQTRLSELAERLETISQQARTELATILVTKGYSGTARRELAEAVDSLEGRCADVRHALQRDRGQL